MKKIAPFLFFIPLLLLNSCGEDNLDITAPTIDVQQFIPQPGNGEVCGSNIENVFALKGGEDLSLDLIFRDNSALSQYKIDIHNNFDCHGHGDSSAPGVTVPNVDNETADWTVLDIKELNGTENPIVQRLSVPENVTAGNYHFQLQVIDAAGNDNPQSNIYTLKILNPVDETIPQIEASTPLGMGFSLVKGDKIQFNGQVTDNYSLSEGGNGVLYLSYTDLSSGNTFNTDAVFSFDNSVDTVYDFSFEYEVPLTLKAGSYLFSLGANDGVRNVAKNVVFNVEVTN